MVYSDLNNKYNINIPVEDYKKVTFQKHSSIQSKTV